MDLYTLAALLCLITGGLALDGYVNPKTLAVHVVHGGDDTGAGIEKGLVASTVNYEVDRMAGVRSLLARPHIVPSDEKGFVGLLGEATGTAAILNVITSAFQDTPNALNFGVYTYDGKFKVFIFGLATSVPRGSGRFDLTVTAEDGETPVDTIKRATVIGAAHIDPYLAMLHMLTEMERTGQERYATTALAISEFAKSQTPPSAESLLLARLQNLEGLVQLRRGKLDLASAAFANGLSRVPPGNNGPTTVILQLNKAFVDVARNDTDGAAPLLVQVTASTNNFQNLLGVGYLSSEGVAYTLNQEEVDSLRAAYDTTSAYIALRRNKMGEAEAIVKKELLANPNRLNAIDLLADIEGMRGNQTAARAIAGSAVQQSLAINPFLEIAHFHARLSFTADSVSLKPSQYILR
jgi:hypothetical protein